MLLKAYRVLPVNRRFTFQPAAVTFPTTPEQVSTIVQTAVKYNRHVVARSGGVNHCQLLFVFQKPFLTRLDSIAMSRMA